MKQTNKLSQAGRSSLQNWSSQPPVPSSHPPLPHGTPSSHIQKPILLSFTANNLLYKQLSKPPLHPSSSSPHHPQTTKELLQSAREFKEYQKSHTISEEEKLMLEIKNLSDFKPVSTNSKTKDIVEGIIFQKREQHIRVYEEFQEEIEGSLANIVSMENTIKSETESYFATNKQEISAYLHTLTDAALLTKPNTLPQQITSLISLHSSQRQDKLSSANLSLLSLYTDTTSQYQHRISTLQESFKDIAFLPQHQTAKICLEESEKLHEVIQESTARVAEFITRVTEETTADFQSLKEELESKKERWGEVNREAKLQEFTTKLTDPRFSKTPRRDELFLELRQAQQRIHSQREQLVTALVQTPLDRLSKPTIERWIEDLKSRSEEINTTIDTLFSALLAEISVNTQRGEQEIALLTSQLTYYHTPPADIASLVSATCTPLLIQNSQNEKLLLSSCIAYIEKYESLEHDVCEKLGRWFLEYAGKIDTLRVKIAQEKQEFELQKARILDEDEERVEELQGELQGLKKELKESLHHVKLEEVEEKCWGKVEEIERHYREVYERNKGLVGKHPERITEVFEGMEGEIVGVWGLVGVDKREEELKKVMANNERVAMRMIEREDVVRGQEAERAREEESKKKGGKAVPPAKPKDPKKQAAEMEERKQAILKSFGVPAVKEVSVNGKQWIVAKEVEEIVREFYASSLGGEIGTSPPLDEESPAPLDLVPPPPHDPTGTPLLSSSILLPISTLTTSLSSYLPASSLSLLSLRTSTLSLSSLQDKSYLTTALQTLDNHLKSHYPLKSIIQNEIINKRSNEITSHKKRYEKHARVVREKVDEQTERFNLLLERGLEVMKVFAEERKGVREELAGVKGVAGFQGVARKSKEINDRLDFGFKEIVKELKRLAGEELDSLVTKNNDFLKQINHPTHSLPQYSPDELAWYSTMMSEISTQLSAQKLKRSQKLLEIEEHTKKKRAEVVEQFEKEYEGCVDGVAAKDCAGGKYGRPKIVGQERMRVEMNKCERAQEGVRRLVEGLRGKLEGGENEGDVLEIRQQLMTLRTCLGRYLRHLQALKPQNKSSEPLRVNYNLSLPSPLQPSPSSQDLKRLHLELSSLGELSEQKQDRKFNTNILDIVRVIKEQVAKVYTGDKAKYLNADKVPDSLQEYIAVMRKNAEGFRLNCIREVRGCCEELSGMAPKISQRIFSMISHAATSFQQTQCEATHQTISSQRRLNESARALNMKKLSPNLANPASRAQLLALDSLQSLRSPQYLSTLSSLRTSSLSTLFTNSSNFLTSLLNNFEFLILYFDGLYLREDFVVLPGDEVGEKKHMNLKQLMLMRERKGVGVGEVVGSERNVGKRWAGVGWDVFDGEGGRFVYVREEEGKEVGKEGKKAGGGKKEAKDPKKDKEKDKEVVTQEAKVTKEIQSVKTFRQKSAFVERNNVYDDFVKKYAKETQELKRVFGEIEEEEESFRRKWAETVERLKKASE